MIIKTRSTYEKSPTIILSKYTTSIYKNLIPILNLSTGVLVIRKIDKSALTVKGRLFCR